MERSVDGCAIQQHELEVGGGTANVEDAFRVVRVRSGRRPDDLQETEFGHARGGLHHPQFRLGRRRPSSLCGQNAGASQLLLGARRAGTERRQLDWPNGKGQIQ